MNKIELTKQLTDLGFSLQAGEPFSNVDADNWPSISYKVSVSYKGKLVVATTYRLGVGHINVSKINPNATSFSAVYKFTPEEAATAEQWFYTPHVQFTNKTIQASVAAKIAKVQKVVPSLPSVLHSLLMDGEADNQTFEEWADNYGYDTDSRKAERIYNECQQTGKAFRLSVPSEALDRVRELLQDY